MTERRPDPDAWLRREGAPKAAPPSPPAGEEPELDLEALKAALAAERFPLEEEKPAPPPDPAPVAQESSAPEKPKQSKQHKTLRAFLLFLLKLGVIAALGWALLTYVFGVFVVHSNDMYPAIRDGDLCITYRLKPLAKGDIVAYTVDGDRRFGRVAGQAGDVIDMDEDGRYTVNGGIPYETIYYDTRSDPDSSITYPYTVGADELFLLNDLRDNTGDSRRFGAIPLSDTDGSVVLLLRRRGW